MNLKGKLQAGLIETVAAVISAVEYFHDEQMQLPEVGFLSFA